MSGNKTVPTNAPVPDFLQGLEDPKQLEDSVRLIRFMKEITGQDPVMGGPSFIGFGKYHYRYESGREGDMLQVGFSPWKGKLEMYIGANSTQNKPLLEKLGRHDSGKSCLYIRRLDEVDTAVLRQIITNTYQNWKTYNLHIKH